MINEIDYFELLEKERRIIELIKNETEIVQIYYNKFREPIELKPGETYEEGQNEVLNVRELVRKQEVSRESETNASKLRKIKRE